MIKVVTAEEMKRIERGGPEEAYMLEAGKKVAAVAKTFPGKKVLLLIGKGNKGGDAYVAGKELLKAGYEVRALLAAPLEECSPLNQKFGERFLAADGSSGCDFIIDGLLGTGFCGEVQGPFAKLMDQANRSKKPILSIDIPSGVNGSTGETSEHTIRAAATVTLGLPKIGLFLKNGWNFVGKLYIEDFGLPQASIDDAKPVAFIPKLSELCLPEQARNQHKYSRGFVLGFGGSSALKGAVKLSGLAALHAGAGVVKIFTLENIGEMPPELICQIFDQKLWNEALEKAGAVFIGPGLGRSSAIKQWLEMERIDKPCVVDADALFFLTDFPKRSILTPHSGEMAHLLKNTNLADERAFVEAKQVIVVLKGAPTTVLAPGKLPVIIPRGDPGMATAGSGDVLSGILAALLAQGMSLFDAAILGVTLHDLAGEACALEKTSYGYSASDLIDALPKALKVFI
jgi:NAD(P)H-hydrate epimerase